MKHRRDPRRGLPSSDELTKTNEPLDKKQTKVAEHDAIEKAVSDLDGGSPED